MQTKTFQKNKENFTCEKCGHENIGNGYTNHCQKCLYSKHVDVNPGDRVEGCKGLMEPIEVFNRGSETFLRHKCVKCGFARVNKVSKEDSFEEVIKVSKKNK